MTPAAMTPDAMTPAVLWRPAPDARSTTAMGRFADRCEVRSGRRLDTYDALWNWSVQDIDGFWAQVLESFDVIGDGSATPVRTGTDMFTTRWFPELSLNYAEHALRHRADVVDDAPAVIGDSQLWGAQSLTWAELRLQVGAVQAGLRRMGVVRGDVVGAYLPNLPQTMVAFLACAGLGATWASCAPEFGVRAVIDRLGQLDPKVLLAVEGYGYGDKSIDRRQDLAEIRAGLPSLRHTVVLPGPDGAVAADAVSTWSDLLAEPGEVATERVPFAHPLYVLFSSGTTGLPKPIVHGHGGILLEHLKALGLHADLGPGDRFFWFSTTGWMMWNLLVSGLCVGTTVVCFDGDPVRPDPSTLWAMAERSAVTYFGTSASYLMAEQRRGSTPTTDHDLSAVRVVGSTGSPLPDAGFRWLHEQFGTGVQIASLSGGTDVCSAVVGAAPLVPVWSGEISCRYLGAAVTAFDTAARPVIGAQGELVITEPMPSMPVAFAGDPERRRLRGAYYDQIPGVWAHGDWITITERGSCIISGRSDATLNRGGVRLGTSEFYTVVEAIDGVADSLVVHLEDPDGGPGRLLLFVVADEGATLDDELRSTITSAVRAELSPRHVPDDIVQVAGVPRTLSGKKVEVPVKDVLRGADPSEVVSLDSLVDPAALLQFADMTM